MTQPSLATTDNSFCPNPESSASRFFVPCTQDMSQAHEFNDRMRHYEPQSYAAAMPSTCVASGYPATPAFYYAEYYQPSRRSDQMQSFEMCEQTPATDKFSFDDFEVMHAGDILALESPLTSNCNKNVVHANKWSGGQNYGADVSCESVCTHSDSSCDEYIVTSLDDSSTSSAVTGNSFPVENWTSPDAVFPVGVPAQCTPPTLYLQTSLQTGKYEARE